MKPLNSNSYIKEIVYIPSFFNFILDRTVTSCVDDDHFCSILCDKGFTVHVVDYKHKDSMNDVLLDVINWRVREWRVSPRNLCILGQELSVPKVLAFLAEVAFPFKANSTRLDVGAVVLIDPPPLYSLGTSRERVRLLERYLGAFHSFEAFKGMFASTVDVNESHTAKSWDAFRKSMTSNELISAILVESARSMQEGILKESLASSGDEYQCSNVGQDEHAVLAAQLLGSCPTCIPEVSKVLKNRILVVNSFEVESFSSSSNESADPHNTNDSIEEDIWSLIGGSFEHESWGYEAAESVASSYQAGPVIHLEKPLYLSSHSHPLESGLSSMLCERRRWEDALKDWHIEVADTLADWLRLLHQFQHI
jgi:hypothetical protein